jgi:hypothetical protein
MLNFILLSQIIDTDILNNVSDNCKALLIDENDFWIEVLEDGSFLVNDGLRKLPTTNIFEAYINYLEFKAKNS